MRRRSASCCATTSTNGISGSAPPTAAARWLREKSGRIGIIMVTAASDTVDRVVGLETGVDDYIGKPYEPRELLARIKSVLRRSTGAPAISGPRVRMGRRVLDLEKRVLADPADGSEES